MRIIGFNFRKIIAERTSDLKGKLEVKTHMDIERVEKETLDIAGDILKFYYTYSIKYNPNHATISFEGSVLVRPEKEDQIKDILKEWKKKKLPEDIRLAIFNFVMNKCNLKALQLEDEFALPPHIPMPHIPKQQQNSTNYTG
jgi:hypothetical protein